jgi:probable F420-dependent oxidoreductase
VDLGVTIFLTDQTIGPVEVARAVEERGFHSLYLPEHTHIPVERRTPPPTGHAELPEMYKRVVDPYIALAAAAAATERILLGTGIALVAQHDPITLAKEIATLDHVSGGRFVLGVGFGWNEDEMEDHGVEYRTRRARVREHMLLMNALWADDVGAFDGEFVRVAPSWSWPKPVQRPRPRTLMGGAPGPKLFAHIAEYADGWFPIGGAGVARALPDLRAAVAAVGRDPDALHVIPFGTLPSPGKLEHYREIGMTEVVLNLPSAGRDDVLRTLDDYANYL